MAFIEPMYRNKPNITYLLTSSSSELCHGSRGSLLCKILSVTSNSQFWSPSQSSNFSLLKVCFDFSITSFTRVLCCLNYKSQFAILFWAIGVLVYGVSTCQFQSCNTVPAGGRKKNSRLVYICFLFFSNPLPFTHAHIYMTIHSRSRRGETTNKANNAAKQQNTKQCGLATQIPNISSNQSAK